mgnify:CR=1 FL=1
MSTSEAQKRASNNYRRRQVDDGRMRLSGGLVPPDVAEALKAIVERGDAETPTGAIWYAVRLVETGRTHSE